jgi:CDP-2,3-bis-(O-geranylgeranyl)-sn-glycerol synthase
LDGNIYLIIIYPLVYILPAYAANGAPVIFGGGRPLDLGKRFGKKRIFGNSKSIRGAIAGLIAGIMVGIAESQVFPYLLYISIALALGAIFGDLLGSFIKRQAGMKPGTTVPFLDQYGFFVFALLFALPFGNLPTLYGFLFLLLLTGPLHLIANICANKLKLKKVPW